MNPHNGDPLGDPGDGRPSLDDQTLSDTEQTLSDADQTYGDSDQTSSDSDQISSDRDQVASDRDQEASDRDLAHGVDPHHHSVTKDLRRLGTRERGLTAHSRLADGDRRDKAALGRDLAAVARDRAAEARDLAIAQAEAAAEQVDEIRPRTGAELLFRAAEQRRRAAEQRTSAAEYRMYAARDRAAAAVDREHAAGERERAQADRHALAQELMHAATDSLTGARMREPGLAELQNEIDRCRRINGALVAVYVDVVGLKARNDAEGHQAGDELLKRVVSEIREHLRSYDLVIRLGGDEFLCGMSNVDCDDARRRFYAVGEALAKGPAPASISAGYALLSDGESAEALVARADADLLVNRSPDDSRDG